jgi:hypothetical protein
LHQVVHSQKIVTPAKSGVHWYSNYLKDLDSGFRRNDGKLSVETLPKIIMFELPATAGLALRVGKILNP